MGLPPSPLVLLVREGGKREASVGGALRRNPGVVQQSCQRLALARATATGHLALRCVRDRPGAVHLPLHYEA